MIVLDTNIAIAYLAGDHNVTPALNAAIITEDVVLPTIVIAEILSYSNFDEPTMTRTHEWLETLTVVPLDIAIAEQAAELRRATKMKLIDCVVAATALTNNASLATRDQEFTKISKLTILTW